jgi:hypothetical protein
MGCGRTFDSHGISGRPLVLSSYENHQSTGSMHHAHGLPVLSDDLGQINLPLKTFFKKPHFFTHVEPLPPLQGKPLQARQAKYQCHH